MGNINGPFRGPDGYTYPKPAKKKSKKKDASATVEELEGDAEQVSANSERPSVMLPTFKDPADMCFFFHTHFTSNKQLQKKYIALSSDKVVTSSGPGINSFARLFVAASSFCFVSFELQSHPQ